jgi:hypothetical protein
MASGIHGHCNRPKTRLKSGSKKKRLRGTSEAQAKYHAAIALRRAKKLKKNRK